MRRQRREQSEFMQWVEDHERAWGTREYPGRPILAEILSAKIVVFWKTDDRPTRYTVTLYTGGQDLENAFFRMFFGTASGEFRQPARIFQDQKRYIVKAVRFIFGEVVDDVPRT
jgi:hypothetical protein